MRPHPDDPTIQTVTIEELEELEPALAPVFRDVQEFRRQGLSYLSAMMVLTTSEDSPLPPVAQQLLAAIVCRDCPEVGDALQRLAERRIAVDTGGRGELN